MWLGNTHRFDVPERKKWNTEHIAELKELLDQEFTENHYRIREQATKDKDYTKAWLRSEKASQYYVKHLLRLFS